MKCKALLANRAPKCWLDLIRGRGVLLSLGGVFLAAVTGMLPLVGLGDDRVIQAAPATTQSAEIYSGWPFDAKEASKRQNDTAKAWLLLAAPSSSMSTPHRR